MTRLLLLMCVGAAMLAAEAGGSAVPAAARTAQDQAQVELAEVRLRIANEQAALLRSLQEAINAADAARERLAGATRSAQATNDELRTRSRDRERDLALVRQISNRAVVAARLPDADARSLARRSPIERVEAAVTAAERRMQALPGRIGLRVVPESVIGRLGAVAQVPVLRLGEARAVALGDDRDHCGLLERATDGSAWRVVGPELPATALLRAGAVTMVPFDATGTAAHQAGSVHRTLQQWIQAGRFFIWPIIAAGLLGLIIAIERTVVLLRRRVDPGRLVLVATALDRGDASSARALVAAGATPLDRVLGASLAALGRPREARESAVEQALLVETGQLTRGLAIIAVLAGVAPLLGLLGTVTGMIDMFSVIAAQGSGNAKSLSGGISEALICTQAGMMVAIPLLLLHAWLDRLAERRSHVLEEAACGMLGLAEYGLEGSAA